MLGGVKKAGSKKTIMKRKEQMQRGLEGEGCREEVELHIWTPVSVGQTGSHWMI